MKRIVAVAVGDPGFFPIRNKDDLKDAGPRKVRRYLHGLVAGLNRSGYRFGTNAANNKHFIIDFRLADAGGLQNVATFRDENGNSPDLIFAMSTKVAKSAGAFNLGVPIVAVVSEPQVEMLDQDPYCGISARRVQTAGEGFNNFRLAVPSLTRIFILGNSSYDISNRARANVLAAATAASFAVQDIDVTSLSMLEQLLRAHLPARTVDDPCLNGLLVLPVDMFLGRANDIIRVSQKVKNVPAFLPVPDWVRGKLPSALGAYGVPQRRCGVLMAEQVKSVLATNQIPQGPNRWMFVPDYDFEFSTSAPAAQDMGITLGDDIPPPEE